MSTHSEQKFKNFKIPKRKLDGNLYTQTTNRGHPDQTQSNDQVRYQHSAENPVLESSYYNYYDKNPVMGWQYSFQQTSSNKPHSVTRNIYNSLSTYREKPKNYKKDIYRETVPDVEDSTLPKELTSMFQPLYCKLCTAQLSSNIMAKLHYKSKNHEKKIKKFLIDYSQTTGEPLHKRARILGAVKNEGEHNPVWFHCNVCDLPLTGKLHAESHYMGKNHQKALLGQKLPAGKGFYNNEGKWVRQSKSSGINVAIEEDTFGLNFRPKQTIQKPTTLVTAPIQSSAKFYCEICNVGATCQEQIEMHYKGQKHQKKLKQLGLVKLDTLGTVLTYAKQQPESNKEKDFLNLSVYRTPSGDLYCPCCNVTLNSEPQFKVHLQSKGHIRRSNKAQ